MLNKGDVLAAVVGAVALAAAAPATASVFTIDKFTVSKTGPGTIFADPFSDGNAPPSVADPAITWNCPPGFSAPCLNYNTTGTFGESDGRAIMNSASGQLNLALTGTSGYFHQALLLTPGPGSTTTNGLRTNQSFQVEGVFDIVLPTKQEQFYGIRLMDRVQSGLYAQPGDDVLQLSVIYYNGAIRLHFTEHDFVANQINLIQSALFDMALLDDSLGGSLSDGATQIALRLEHEAANNGVVIAYYEYLTSGGAVVDSLTHALGALGTDPNQTIFNGEDWTRPSFVAFDPVPEPMTLALFGLGLARLGYAGRRRRR